MGFDVALNRDQKRLAEAKVRDLPIDHSLRAKYLDWINELDLRLGIHQTHDSLNEQARRTTSKKKALVGGRCDDKGTIELKRAEDVAVATFQAVEGTSPRPVTPDRSKAQSTIRPDARKAGHGGSAAPLQREQLLRENQLLQDMLARYL